MKRPITTLLAALAALAAQAVPATAQVPESWWYQEIPAATLPTAVPEIQSRLKEAGCYAGSVDGRFGPLTRGAIMAWQKVAGVPETGIISEPLVQTLGTQTYRCARPARAAR